VMRLLERCDAFRRPERFLQMLAACECDATGRLGFEDRPYPQRARLAAALKTAQDVDTKTVSAQAIERGLKGQAIADAIRQARVRALAAALDTPPDDTAP
jgi:tRNA nucleotidyltransferase (CCA-adding enzyme)